MIMDGNDLRPHHPDMVCGGGHIHIGLKNNKLRLEVVRSVCNHVFLPWIFSEPDEEGSCDNFITCTDTWSRMQSAYETIVGNGRDIASLDYLKDYSVRASDFGTVELRFFEAPYTWEEQWDQLEFALRYVQMVERKYNAGHRIMVNELSTIELQNITSKQVIYRFRKLLRELGLEYKRYSKYIRRNLLPRWEDGRVRY